MLQQTVAMKLEQLEEERQHQIVLKDSSISELREVVGQLTSDPGLGRSFDVSLSRCDSE